MHERRSIVHAFISSRLDYCNSLLFGIGEGLVKKLQSVQMRRPDLSWGSRNTIISPLAVLRDLHWLPISKRIVFRIAILVYKSLHGLAPPYLADDCISWRLLWLVVRSCALPPTSTLFGTENLADLDFEHLQ